MADWTSGASPSGDAEPFVNAEQEANWLRQERAAGRISEEQLRTRLQELMIQDEQGRWWIIGYETGQWYYHDGEK